jgi:hypothetical protein
LTSWRTATILNLPADSGTRQPASKPARNHRIGEGLRMAFGEKIVPNLRGVPRVFQPDEPVRRDPSPQLTDKQRDAAMRYAREHRISLSQAVKELYED